MHTLHLVKHVNAFPDLTLSFLYIFLNFLNSNISVFNFAFPVSLLVSSANYVITEVLSLIHI